MATRQAEGQGRGPRRQDSSKKHKHSKVVPLNSVNSSESSDIPPTGAAGNRLPDNVLSWFQRRNRETLGGARAFVPWILQESYFDKKLQENQIVFHQGEGAVVFSDASGFTALTERLALKSNGAELLSQCLTSFFTPLIDIINAYRGDVIKFSGDALTIYFPAVDDVKNPRYNLPVPPHGTYGLPDLGAMATAVLRAAACCIEIHKRLHMFDTGVDGVRLCLHIGVGCGEVSLLQVGGVVPPETHVPRCEYIIAGAPLEQISIAEPLAKNGQTCLSHQAWKHVDKCVIEGHPLEDRPDFHLLERMDDKNYTFPTIKYTAMAADHRQEHAFRLTELNEIRRYIPSAVFKQIEGGTLTYVNEMRNISTIFISGSGVNVSTNDGPNVAQDLMSSVQRACYAYEGTLNKFVIDDKGMLFLLVYGLPPLVHTDDASRAVLACFDMVKIFKRLGLVGRFGVTTGRNYCGICGSPSRMEYTVLGDTVNLSARLMANAVPLGILIDEATQSLVTSEVAVTALTPIHVKGKSNAIPIFQPSLKDPPQYIGLGPGNKIHFPWYERAFGGASTSPGSKRSASVASSFNSNVRHLCGLRNWPGITKIQGMLGGVFSTTLHQTDGVFNPNGPTTLAPPGSPFSEGGVVVIAGPTGMGKIELAEHVVMHCATHLQIFPVFGSMGPRPTDYLRVISELLRSMLGLFRFLDRSVDADDCKALSQKLPTSYAPKKAVLDQLLQHCFPVEDQNAIFELGLNACVDLLKGLNEKTSVVVTLQLEFGTNLFSKTLEVFNNFWKIANRLTDLVKPGSQKPLIVMLLVKEANTAQPCVQLARTKDSYLMMRPLSEENVVEYMGGYLKVREAMVPVPLRQFVVKITLGNPLYIRETIDQLEHNKHIQVLCGAGGLVERLDYHSDLEGINISSWSHTAMVGETVCLLESLDPLEAAVLKMSTVFTGESGFTISDLASSSCSRWAGATHFDYLRLYRAIRNLVQRDIIEEVVGGVHDDGVELQKGDDGPNGGCKSIVLGRKNSYLLRNVLIRKVGSAMVLESQKKAVKRQALIDRALRNDLPKRLQEMNDRKKVIHIPWYYENVLKRMPAA